MRKLAFVLVLGLVAGCDDDDSGSGSIAIDDITTAMRDKSCGVYVECGLIEDLALCRSLFTDTLVDPDLVAAVNAGKIIYRPDQAAACIDGLAGSCDATNAPGERTPDACSRMLEGTVAEGGACALDEECISQDCNIQDCAPDTCCQGTCEPGEVALPPHLGESCTIPGSCVDSYCDLSTGICTALLADGAACESASQCASASCLGTLCRPRVDTGEPCGPLAECALIGDTCSEQTMTCTPVGLVGDACTTYADCSPFYACDSATDKCVRPPIAGESCAETQECFDTSYCDLTTGLCTARKADGQPCESDLLCQSETCDPVTSTCVTLPVCI